MLDYFIYAYGNQLALTALCAIFGCFGYVASRLASRFFNDKTKRAVAKTVVQFVEQVWKTIHGEEKLEKALEKAEVLLQKKGIKYDAEEMKIMIEAALAEFNEAFKKGE